MLEKNDQFSYFTLEKDKALLERAVAISWSSKEHGNTPFGALLVDEQGNILMEQENIEITEKDCTGHAETTLIRRASKAYDKSFLARCSLYSTAEPCVMCAGALYWSGIGRLVYAISEKKLLMLTGDNEQNPTLDVPCRTVFEHGQKDVLVVGPIEDEALENMVVAPHIGYWD